MSRSCTCSSSWLRSRVRCGPFLLPRATPIVLAFIRDHVVFLFSFDAAFVWQLPSVYFPPLGLTAAPFRSFRLCHGGHDRAQREHRQEAKPTVLIRPMFFTAPFPSCRCQIDRRHRPSLAIARPDAALGRGHAQGSRRGRQRPPPRCTPVRPPSTTRLLFGEFVEHTKLVLGFQRLSPFQARTTNWAAIQSRDGKGDSARLCSVTGSAPCPQGMGMPSFPASVLTSKRSAMFFEHVLSAGSATSGAPRPPCTSNVAAPHANRVTSGKDRSLRLLPLRSARRPRHARNSIGPFSAVQ